MSSRRLVGIDLGIASAHTVRVLDETGGRCAGAGAGRPWRVWPLVEQAALAGRPGGRGAGGGDRADRAGVAADRGVLHRPRASSCIGCPRPRRPTCAGSCPGTRRATVSTPTPWPGCRWSTRTGCTRCELPDAERAALDRRVRATDRLTRAGARAQGADQGPGPAADAADPADRRSGRGRPGGAGAVGRPAGAAPAGSPAHRGDRARPPTATRAPSGPSSGWPRRAAVELYADHPAVAFTDLAAEVATEVRLLRAIQAELADHAAEPGRRPTGGPTRLSSPAPCPAWPRSAAPPWSPRSATRPGSPPARRSKSYTGLAPRRRRPATPTARANPCPRPVPGCCAPP